MSRKVTGAIQPPLELKASVQTILRSYFEALQAGNDALKLPDPAYHWRHYDAQDREVFRERLADLDAYLRAPPQADWVMRVRKEVLSPPELSRLSDGPMLAMYQELDTVYADYFEETEPL